MFNVIDIDQQANPRFGPQVPSYGWAENHQEDSEEMTMVRFKPHARGMLKKHVTERA